MELIGAVYKRRDPRGSGPERVKVLGLVAGNEQLGLSDELSIQSTEFGPVLSATVESLSAAYDLEAEGPGYQPEPVREATHR